MVAVEVLVKVGFTVPVIVVQNHDLIAARDVDLAPHHLDPKRLEQPGRNPPPGEFPRLAVDPVDLPHVAVPGAEHSLLPPGRKSRPVKRIWHSQGLLSGSVSTSTANGPSSPPAFACVERTAPHKGAPPRVSAERTGAGSPRLIELAAESASASVEGPQIQSVKRMASGPLGTVSRRFPCSAVCHVNPPAALDRPAATIPAAPEVVFCRPVVRTLPLPDAFVPSPVHGVGRAVGAAPAWSQPRRRVTRLRPKHPSSRCARTGRTWQVRDLQHQIPLARPDLERPSEDRRRSERPRDPGVSSTAVVPTV